MFAVLLTQRNVSTIYINNSVNQIDLWSTPSQIQRFFIFFVYYGISGYITILHTTLQIHGSLKLNGQMPHIFGKVKGVCIVKDVSEDTKGCWVSTVLSSAHILTINVFKNTL